MQGARRHHTPEARPEYGLRDAGPKGTGGRRPSAHRVAPAVCSARQPGSG